MPIPENIIIKQLDLEINGGCNFKCTMCPQSTGREKDFLKKMPFEVFTKIVNECMNYGLDTVSLHGSGEPTLSKDMPKYVEYIKSKKLKCISFTNGYRLTKNMSKSLIASGIDILRISCIGYDRKTYAHWMSRDVFDEVRENLKTFVELNKKMNGTSEVHVHHLITDINKKEKEINSYRKNWSEYTGAKAEIWLMHNWAGSSLELGYYRDEKNQYKRSCGRPFSPLLQVRAGGLDGHSGAVVACCMVLGKDSTAVLGHLDTQSVQEIISGQLFTKLRDAHKSNDFDTIPYCADCDQLYDVPSALVWTNIEGRKYGQSKVVDKMDHRQFINN
jgi:wyosine [tRNA(Phe)-imidazoG37] synthetase (radical SAM superfamily)